MSDLAPMMGFGRRFWTIAALSLAPAVSNSFARFAYALLLPAMRSELGLNYSQARSLNTANALGYLAGALFSVRYASRLGNRRLFCVGMVEWLTPASFISGEMAEWSKVPDSKSALAGYKIYCLFKQVRSCCENSNAVFGGKCYP